MKNKVFIIFLLLLTAWPVKAQLPVTDAAVLAATIQAHTQSYGNAIQSATTLLNTLDVMKKAQENMRAVKDVYDKVNEKIYQIREIIEATENLVNITKQSAEIYRQVVRSNQFTVSELTYILDYLNSAVLSATHNIEKIGKVLDPYLPLTSKERMDLIEEADAKTRKTLEELFEKKKHLTEIIVAGAKIKKLTDEKLVSPLEMYYANSSPNTKDVLLPGMELVYLFAQANLEKETEFDTATSAAQKTTQLFADFKKLYYALSAFIALLGAFKVYSKINHGEDNIGKSIGIWFTAVLAIFILGSIVELFLTI